MRKQGMQYGAEKQAKAEQLGYKSFFDAIEKLYRNGLSTRQVGKVFDMTPMGIRYRLKQLGVEMKPRGGNWRRYGRIL